MWNVRVNVVALIIGVTGSIWKTWQKCLEDILQNISERSGRDGHCEQCTQTVKKKKTAAFYFIWTVLTICRYVMLLTGKF
jgi:hypothetical protein